MGRKQYAFLRMGYEYSWIRSKTLTETKNFEAGTDLLVSSIKYGQSNIGLTPEIGYEFFNNNGHLISIGLKYHHKFSGDDLLRWTYTADNRADGADRLVTTDGINVSGSYVALTLQFNGLLSYKTKRERVKKQKKQKPDPVLVDTTPTVVDTTTTVVDVDDKQVNDRDYKVTHKVKVKTSKVKITIWDHQIEDGDRVNLILNNEQILTNYTLRNKKLVLEVELKEGTNDFVLYALNLGKYKPNTAAITIDDGIKEHKVVLESTLEESGAIEIKLDSK